MSNAAKVELYVSKRPYIREALAEGIVNYSALARKIADEEGLDSIDAIKAALTRYQNHISDEREEQRDKVSSVLNQTSISVTVDVSVQKKDLPEAIVHAKTQNGFTSVVNNGDKALVSLESPTSLENVSGVLEFILSSIAAEGINVDHLISCREDTHLVVDSEDASRVLELLQQRMN